MPTIQLPYQADSRTLFECIRDLPFSCWLDSGKPKSHSGRYDIMAAQPTQRWVYQSQQLRHQQYSHGIYHASSLTDDPIDCIKRASDTIINQHTGEQNAPLPFHGGIIAYFAYDYHSQVNKAEGKQRGSQTKKYSQQQCQLPDMVASLYSWGIIQDHELKQCWLTSLSEVSLAELEPIVQRLPSFDASPHQSDSSSLLAHSFSIQTMEPHTSELNYRKKIDVINNYINAGDCYQVNLSQCFSANYQGDPYIAYRQLRETMASPFSAFIDLGEQSILSLSPERFIKTQGKKVLTQPIKGTIARSADPHVDQANARLLQASEKNRAENLMIVDLLRNDLGKSCIPGSIAVPILFELKSFPNVHHLVSSVTGTLTETKTPWDVFADSFPGGSITGAPKKRAMEIIEELEDHQRSIYCGSIAYISANGHLDSNITIRTIACDEEKIYCWGGGGIVADSVANDEYQESLTKIDAMLTVLKQFETS